MASIRLHRTSHRMLTASVPPSPFPEHSPGAWRGFTLIELLVVVLILGVLTAIALPLFLSSVHSASAQTVHANLRTIGQAGRAYYLKYGQYPASVDDLVGPGKDIESISGPRGVTYDIDVSVAAGGNGSGSGNGKGNNGKGGGTGAPGNGKGQGNPGGGKGNPSNSGGGGTATPDLSTCIIRATENGADAFGSPATDDTATLTLPDSSYSGL